MSPWTVACQASLLMRFPRQNTGVGCPFLFQGIFLTQGLNPHLLCLLHCRCEFFKAEPSGKPGIVVQRFCWNPLRVHYKRWLGGKEFACHARDAGDTGSSPGSGRSPGVGNGNPLQYSCLENCMDRGTWCAVVHVVAQSMNWAAKHEHENWVLPVGGSRESFSYQV